MDQFWRLRVLEKTLSTQDDIKVLARAGEAEGAAVQALSQSAGRGRHGRKWVSEPGNLFLSLLLRPGCACADIGQMSIMTGLAIARAIGSFDDGIRKILSLKWPNDILLDEKKCAGILLECEHDASYRVEWLVIGIGVNVRSAPADIGKSLASCLPEPPPLKNICDRVLSEIARHYRRWKEEGMVGIRQEWLSLAHQAGTSLCTEGAGTGYFHDIDEKGNLLMHDDKNRLIKISAGDVYLAQKGTV